MSDKLKITFTGGDEIGEEVELDFGSRLVVGRSHSADVRVSEPDVSGRHLELIRGADGCFVRNISRFPSVVDGRALATGEEAALRVQSAIELGKHLRIRIDRLPQAASGNGPETRAVDETHATQAMGAGETAATAFGESATFATRAGATVATPSPAVDPLTGGRVEESATRDVDSLFAESVRTLSDQGPDSEEMQGNALDDEDTADEPMPPAAGVSLAGLTAEALPEEAMRGSTDTALGDVTDTGADAAPDGETQEMVTRIGSVEELLERRRQLDRAVAGRHWRFGVCIALLFAALGAVWYATSNRKHVDDAEGPFLDNGEPDVLSCDIVGDLGTPDMFIEYPRNERMSVVASATTNEIEINSFIGRDRDVPFRSWFNRRQDAAELKLSLVESFGRWMDKMTKGKGFSFERTRNGKSIDLEFFDDVFPGFCEYTTQHGVTFVRAESSHTVGKVVWRGIVYMFRNGDTTCVVCNEIPEMYWKRGEMRLRNEPFFGLCAGFIRRQWDSPGADGLLQNVSEDELISKISYALSIETPGNFANVEKWMDSLMAATWGKKTANARTALELRKKFLDAKKKFYNERRLAYATARANGATKQMRSIFWDCQKTFGELKRDRRRSMVNNPEVWECQEEQ